MALIEKRCEGDLAYIGSFWMGLLPELLQNIGDRLETDIEIRRFRSVCSSWRSSRLPRTNLSFPLRLPFPSPIPNYLISPNSKMSEGTFYILETPETLKFGRKSWLLKLKRSNDGTMRALNPFSNSPMPELTAELPKVLNLKNLRVTELAKVYSIQYVDGNHIEVYARKALLISSSPNCEYAVWVVNHKGRLGHYKSGDADWTWYDLANDFCDIIRFKDKYYSVDAMGTVFMFDDSSKLTCIPKPSSAPWGRWKYLIESDGKLFLVVLIRNGYNLSKDKLRIYKLDMNGLKWEELKGLKNQLLFLGLDCSFLVPAGDLTWVEGSWVFMAEGDVFGGLLGRGIGEGKDLGNGNLSPIPLIAYPQYGTIFWPPPSWVVQA